MTISIIHGRDTRQIIFTIARLLKNSQKFYKRYDHVIFFPSNVTIPSLSILPRLPQQQVQFINFLNKSQKNILFVFCTSNSFKKHRNLIDLNKKNVIVAQKNGQNLHLDGDHYIGVQSNLEGNKLMKGKKNQLQKHIDKIKSLKKGQTFFFNSQGSCVL